MTELTGKYIVDKNENMDHYLKETGVSHDISKKMMTPGVAVNVLEEGNKYTMSYSFGSKIAFTLNEEFHEPFTKTLKVKSIAKRDGNKITINSKTTNGRTGSRTYEFTDNAIAVVMSFNGVTAKRYYKKVIM